MPKCLAHMTAKKLWHPGKDGKDRQNSRATLLSRILQQIHRRTQTHLLQRQATASESEVSRHPIAKRTPKMTRHLLPNRRPCVTLDTNFGPHPITVTVGLYPDTGAPSEVFADFGKGGDMAAVCRDAAVALSLALQHGAEPATLDKTMTRIPVTALVDGAMVETVAYASPVGAIVGAMMGVVQNSS
jgi:hypothetical protein